MILQAERGNEEWLDLTDFVSWVSAHSLVTTIGHSPNSNLIPNLKDSIQNKDLFIFYTIFQFIIYSFFFVANIWFIWCVSFFMVT